MKIEQGSVLDELRGWQRVFFRGSAGGCTEAAYHTPPPQQWSDAAADGPSSLGRPSTIGAGMHVEGAMEVVMRLVALADTHTFHDRVQVPDGDVLVHAGDLCRGGDLDELAQAVNWLRSLPHATKIVVAGNHDGSFQENRQAAVACCGKDIIYLEDSETSVEGIRFWGSPWQPAYNDWAFNLERGTPLARKWALIPSRIDVLITHGPPFGIGDRSSVAGRHGCEDLLSRVHEVRPRLHIFGHIHEDGGVWRRDGILFANVTTWEGERPVTIFEIEPGPGNAVDDIFVPEALVPSCADWHSPAGGR